MHKETRGLKNIILLITRSWFPEFGSNNNWYYYYHLFSTNESVFVKSY